jgi:hypothetical protein
MPQNSDRVSCGPPVCARRALALVLAPQRGALLGLPGLPPCASPCQADALCEVYLSFPATPPGLIAPALHAAGSHDGLPTWADCDVLVHNLDRLLSAQAVARALGAPRGGGGNHLSDVDRGQPAAADLLPGAARRQASTPSRATRSTRETFSVAKSTVLGDFQRCQALLWIVLSAHAWTKVASSGLSFTSTRLLKLVPRRKA